MPRSVSAPVSSNIIPNRCQPSRRKHWISPAPPTPSVTELPGQAPAASEKPPAKPESSPSKTTGARLKDAAIRWSAFGTPL